MSSQDENPLSDASSTRPILTPPAETSHTSSDGAASGLRKRKRDGNTMEDILKDPFAVKSYPSTAIKPRTLHPLLLLPRSHLPLSSLDISPFPSGLPQSRLFESHVKILELEDRMGSQPVVLIARLDDGHSLYAVEREARGLYVLFHLGSWVDLQQLRATAVASRQDLSKASDRPLVFSTTLEAAPVMTPECSKYSKKKRLAIEAIQSMVKRPSMSLATPTETHVAPVPAPVPQGLAKDSQPQDMLNVNPSQDDAAPPTANEIFENVRNQYFEALYLSKASLAYFAKGPLSRARAAFHLDYDSTLDMAEHITFLENLIMSTTIIDKKYRDGVPGCVSSIDILDQSADEAKNAEKMKKRKTNKKMKPGRSGLYPMEDLLIRRWWAGHDNEADLGAPGTSREELAKTRIFQLRIRETQLQMIIILEVLALQRLASASEETDTSLPATLLQSADSSGKQKAAKTKPPEHLAILIDVHIDRLCIWQSIAIETVKAPLDGAASHSEKVGGSSTSGNTDNILRDFCVEVILPFFAARLPDRCAAINRKLGGPVVASPKPKLPRAASTPNLLSRPGAATKRPVPAKPRRSLQRVLTDKRERRSVSSGSGRSISLMRSATAPVVLGLKREASETPSLRSIPFADAQPVQASRGGVLNSKRFSRREVDMSSLVPKVASKRNTQVNIEAELREAISALKKPNRELAGRALAETAEKRSTLAPHARKSKKPVHNPLFQGVQITATPKASRRKDIFTDTQRCGVLRVVEYADSDAIPPSSLPRMPQSVTRPSREEQTKKPPFSIQATPTRKSISNLTQGGNGLLSVTANESDCQVLSPLQLYRSSNQVFSLALETKVPPSSTPSSGKENMGLKGGISNSLKEKFDQRQEDSIYKALGWDDADDIDDFA